jgi:hypothetical protein
MEPNPDTERSEEYGLYRHGELRCAAIELDPEKHILKWLDMRTEGTAKRHTDYKQRGP